MMEAGLTALMNAAAKAKQSEYNSKKIIFPRRIMV